MQGLRAYSQSDRGNVREENEDSLLVHLPADENVHNEKGILAVVADGVGGAACGKIASSMAVDLIRESYYRASSGTAMQRLCGSLSEANRLIFEKGQQDRLCRGMATTCTAALVLGNQGFIAHVGDSRAYLLRRGSLHQITRDHTLVAKLIEEGLLGAEAARSHPQRNVITRCMGSSSALEPDTFQVDLEENDVLLLCSDGLHGLVPDEDIACAISGHRLENAGSILVELAKNNGGSDNISVILLQLSAADHSTLTPTRQFPPLKKNAGRSLVISALILCAIVSFCILFRYVGPGF